ncbi:MAG: BlaI/MecI/CopY family transcriptional regulator [Tepidisphaeraceae bacterium]
MAKIPRISDAEWQVMDVLWSAAEAMTANDVVDALAGQSDWSAATIKTLLNRLTKKGALRFKADGKRYLYAPAVSRDACVRTQGRSFLHRVFGGDALPMLAHFVEDAKLTRNEIEQLRKLLDGKKGR